MTLLSSHFCGHPVSLVDLARFIFVNFIYEGLLSSAPGEPCIVHVRHHVLTCSIHGIEQTRDHVACSGWMDGHVFLTDFDK